MNTLVEQKKLKRPKLTGTKRLNGVLATLLTLCYCLVLLEAIFYIARVGESDYLVPDARIGFKPMTDKRTTQRKEGFSSVTFNSYGMQNDEITLAKPPGTLRVAVFGDSYVEALQVPRPDNYCSLTAQTLSKKLRRPVQVLNFGVANYSVAQDFLRYQDLARKFAPDIVVLVYRVGETEKVLPNSTQGLAFVRPVYFPDKDGKLTYSDAVIKEFAHTSEYKRLKATHLLRRYSRIWGVLGKMQGSWTAFWHKGGGTTVKSAPQPSTAEMPKTEVSSDANRERFVSCYWYMVDDLLRQFAEATRADGAQLVIMRTPFKIEGRSDTVKNPTETNLLRSTAGNIGALFFDLDQELTNEGLDRDKDCFLEFGHFSKAMHRKVAERLSQFIVIQKQPN